MLVTGVSLANERVGVYLIDVDAGIAINTDDINLFISGKYSCRVISISCALGTWGVDAHRCGGGRSNLYLTYRAHRAQ
jgi:hypothetical protein